MNREPNPPATMQMPRGWKQWLKVAGYVVLLLVVAWLYAQQQHELNPAERPPVNAPSRPAGSNSRNSQEANRDNRPQQRSTRRETPRPNDDGPDSTVADSTKSREASSKDAVVQNARVTNEDGRVIYRGDVDLTPTLDRIERGVRLRFSHDGIVFENREKRLPIQASGYYHEFIHPTPDDNGPGGQRIVIGREGEVFYTPDHYRTFRRVR